MQISAIIPVFNEEDHIIDAIESVSWADEIIVVDSFSTDKTLALAQSKGVKILQRAYQYSASQKNWAIPQAKYDWVFILDADERVNESLKEEILKLKKDQCSNSERIARKYSAVGWSKVLKREDQEFKPLYGQYFFRPF